jgi:hypothetical protein
MKLIKNSFKSEEEKSTDSKNKASEQEEMREEQHQLDLKENYEADEKYDESKD